MRNIEDTITVDKIRFELIRYWLTNGCGPIFTKQVLLGCGFDFQSGEFSDKPEFQKLDLLAHKLSNGKTFASDDQVNKELALAKQHNIAIVTIIDPEYPESLRNIYAPPTVLTALGPLKLLSDRTTTGSCFKLAVVGSRKTVPYAFRAIDIVLPELLAIKCTKQDPQAKSCIVTVSGGAIGVDTYVHRQTVTLGGQTIVVLGSGLLDVYPKENLKFFESLVQQGSVVLSSFALNAPPQKHNFPTRNRIIAGLSKGTLIVQAGVKSGALITANFALEEGRDVFVVPGPIDQPEFDGSNKLLSSGATVVCRAQDILEQFGLTSSAKTLENNAQNKEIHKLVSEPIVNKSYSEQAFGDHLNTDQLKPSVSVESEEYKTTVILQLLKQNPLELEYLAKKLAYNYSKLEEEIFELELEGKVEQRFDGLWQVCKRL